MPKNTHNLIPEKEDAFNRAERRSKKYREAMEETKKIRFNLSPIVYLLDDAYEYTGPVKTVSYQGDDVRGKIIFDVEVEVDGSTKVYRTYHNYPLHERDPLYDLAKQIADKHGNYDPDELVGCFVQFTVAYKDYNGLQYCNIDTLEFVEEDEADED